MPEMTTKTDETIQRGQGSAIEAALKKIADRKQEIDEFVDYYEGRHAFNFASEKFATQFGRRLRKMRDNLCRTVVRAPVDRLEIIGFFGEQESDVYKRSWEIWKRSQMPKIAKRVHKDAFKIGDGFVLVWADSQGVARIVRQDARNCCVFYDPETEAVRFGAKVWRDFENFINITLYYADRIEKYISNRPHTDGNMPVKASAFRRRSVGGEPWPVANQFGVCPLFHFGLESSILADVVPLQDALNKELCDLLIGSESNSLRQRWTTGITYEINDETGKSIIPFDRGSEWFTTAETAAKFGEFADVSLSEFINVINDFRNQIANVSGVPPWYFRLSTTQVPSGEAFKKAESRFVALVEDAQREFGETWSAVIRLAMRIDGVGDVERAGDGDAQPVEAFWKSAGLESDSEKLDVAIKKKTIGVSDEQNQSEIGYTDEQIAKMAEQNQAKVKANGDAFKSVFDAGGSIAGE